MGGPSRGRTVPLRGARHLLVPRRQGHGDAAPGVGPRAFLRPLRVPQGAWPLGVLPLPTASARHPIVASVTARPAASRGRRRWGWGWCRRRLLQRGQRSDWRGGWSDVRFDGPVEAEARPTEVPAAVEDTILHLVWRTHHLQVSRGGGLGFDLSF